MLTRCPTSVHAGEGAVWPQRAGTGGGCALGSSNRHNRMRTQQFASSSSSSSRLFASNSNAAPAGTPLWKLIIKQFDDLLVKVRRWRPDADGTRDPMLRFKPQLLLSLLPMPPLRCACCCNATCWVLMLASDPDRRRCG